ncbi:uncharacterized protein [Bemisia tabaci]|uniref:uncharacterized protein n=1 Tax=Bemisia tabaci TaxID=7038 RepID=UPI0008F9BB23|nr:PREDICTED: uncharacterized protein LOC109034799 [Bemisia tabaci]XP_018903694.1 PREDICTED: uncharacterized protein LOC109034799 [Bemisia tabaci]
MVDIFGEIETRLPRFEFCCVPLRLCAILVAIYHTVSVSYMVFYRIPADGLVQWIASHIRAGGETAVMAIMLCLFELPIIFAILSSIAILIYGLLKESLTYLRAFLMVMIFVVVAETIEVFMLYFFASAIVTIKSFSAPTLWIGLDFLSIVVVHSYRVSMTRKLSSQEALQHSQSD